MPRSSVSRRAGGWRAEQLHHGTTVKISHRDCGFLGAVTPAQARRLARMLRRAADEAEMFQRFAPAAGAVSRGAGVENQ